MNSNPLNERTFTSEDYDALSAKAVQVIGRETILAMSRAQAGLWTCPYQTGHSAWLGDLLAMNSRGERMRKPECGWMLL